jgi:Uncharacterized protein conserved in bacteria (DUF2171)
MQSTTLRTPIDLGTTVYGSDGQKIGDVAEIQPNWFVIEKGFIFTKDLYIPMSTIEGEHEGGIRLNMTKADVENTDWSSPPVMQGDDAPGPDAYPQTHTDKRVERSGVSVTDREVQPGHHHDDPKHR